jgi:SAM-dependent methyltransferase
LRELEASSSREADHEQLQRQVTDLTDSLMEACAEFERNVNDPFIIKAAQVEFRERTNSLMSKSYCINRTRTWPQGHQGDYATLEIAYKNAPLSEGIGLYLDRYLLSSSLAQGVRQRIDLLRELLKDQLSARQRPKVLDLACGSCREVFELAPEIKASDARFICVDLDEDALDFALDRFGHAGLTHGQIELRKYNALRIFDYESALIEFGLQDVIYSVGYFDYLPDDFLIKLLDSLYKLLAPGGCLIAAFKDVNYYNPQIFHWLVNWDGFLQRSEEDFERILRFTSIPAAQLTSRRVASGSILFYSIMKP